MLGFDSKLGMYKLRLTVHLNAKLCIKCSQMVKPNLTSGEVINYVTLWHQKYLVIDPGVVYSANVF